MIRKRFWKRLRSIGRDRRAAGSPAKHRFCRMESLESRQLLSVTLPALTDQTVLAGAPLNLALNGSSSAGNPVANTVSVTNSPLTNSQVANPQVTAAVPQGNPSLRITVNSAANGIQGDMVLQLFEDLAPDTVTQITILADSGFYDGLVFHRVIKDFMIQGGDPQGTGSGGPGFTFDDEFDPDLQFTSAGVLAMANSGNDTNGSQFFITTEPTRWLDFNHSIFGFLTQGGSVLTQIESVSTNSSNKPLNNVVMTDVSTFTDTQNGVLRLSVPDGTTGSANVTVTARDTVTNETVSRTFQVTVQADATNDPPFIWGPIAPVYTTANTPVDFDIFGVDVEDNSIYYSGSAATGNGTLTVDHATGTATFTPPSGATGVFKVQVNVGASSTTPGSALDTQTVSIHVTAANGGNTPPALTPASPSLGSTTPTTAKTIDLTDSFLNNGTGTTTVVDPDEDVTISGIALVAVTGSGAWEYSLDDGVTFAPVGTVAATSGLLLPDTARLRYTPNGTTGANATITYRAWDMTSGADGSKVNTTISDSNLAFSTATDTATLAVAGVAPVLTAANPSLGSSDENTAKTVDLTDSFINNGVGTTGITDADPNAVVGGIAVVGVTGRGSWAYSTDGTNFTPVGTVSASSALLLPKTAKLRYTPDNANGETAAITYRAWDTSSGTSGGRVDLSASIAVGGSTAFSTATDTASLTVTSLNDAPVLTSASPSIGGTALGTAKTISLTGTFLNNGTGTTTVADADTGAAVGGIALVSAGGAGTWAYSTDGTTFSSVGTIATTSALLLPKTAQLRYTPNATTSETATITYRAWDATTGTAGSKVDTTTNGAATAFSTVTDTASLAVGTAKLSGFVYIDNNNDGLRTVSGGSHLGLPGVVVKLLRKNTSGNWTEVAGKSPVMTGSDGSYRLEGLAPGTYRVQEDQPADYLDGKETLGQIGGQPYGTAGSDYFEMDCQADENGTEYNFGERGLRPEKISLRLFLASTPSAAESILRTNAAPTVDLSKSLAGTGRSTTYQNGGSPIAIAASDAEIADADSSMLASMNVTISNRLDGDSEKLDVDTSNTSLTSAYAGGILTVTGVATPAVYRQVLSTVKYSNTAASPQGGNRSIAVVVNDGIADSTAAVATVNVLASADQTAPSGYTIAATDTLLNATEATAASFTFTGAEVGATYSYTVISSGGGTPVTGSGTISSATQQVTGINVSSLPDGTLTYSVTLRDTAGNTGGAATATATLDKTAPAGYAVTANDTLLNATEATAAGFAFTGAEVGTTYNYTVTSSGGGTPVTGSGTIASATQQVTGINVSSLPGEMLTYSVTLTDTAGNAGAAATATATLDKTAPTAAITPNGTTVNTSPIAFTVTFSEPVTGVGVGDLAATGSVSGALTLANFQAVSATVYTVDVSGMASGENVTLTLAAAGSGISDTAGNALGANAAATVAFDNIAPTGTITPSGTTVNISPITFTVTFDEAVTGVGVADLAATGSVSGAIGLSNFQAVSATVYTVEAIGAATSENVTLTLTAAGSGITDTAGNALAANATATVTLDTTAPTAAITPNGTTVNTNPISFTISFSEAVSGVDLGDLAATGSQSGTLSLANFQAVSATVYTVDVSGMAAGENVTLTLAVAGSGIKDTADNALVAGAAATVSFDTTAPTAAITPNGTTFNASPITFTLTFDEAVTGVDVGDLAATSSASGALTLANFQAVSATVYTVEVSGMASSESVTLTLTAAGSGIQDTAGNALAANATATVSFDTTAPTAAITPNGGTVNTSPISFPITFSEAVSGVEIGDLAATGSQSGALSLANFQAVSATVYTVDVSGMAAGENVTLTLAASGSGINDAAGNAMAVNAQGTVTFDTTAPTGYTIATDDSLVNAVEAASTSFTFTNAEVGTTYNYTITSSGGGTPVTGSGTISSASQQVTGINVSSLPDGTLNYSVTLTDTAGNVGPAATATATLDKTVPTAAITPNGGPVNTSPIAFTITFDEAVSGVEIGDLAATGSQSGTLALANFQAVSATVYTVDVSGMAAGENATLTLAAAGSGINDAAGNALAVNALGTVTFDTAAPAGYTIATDDSLINAVEAASTSFTFAGAEVGATYSYTISSGGGGSVAGTGTITSPTQNVSGIDLSSLSDGLLTYSVILTDPAGNAGTATTATATLDQTAPTATTTAVVGGGWIGFTINFNEDVTNFDISDLTATGSVTGALEVKNFTVDTPSSYTVRVDKMTDVPPGELVTLRSPSAGSFSDLAGNPAAVDAVFAQFNWVV